MLNLVQIGHAVIEDPENSRIIRENEEILLAQAHEIRENRQPRAIERLRAHHKLTMLERIDAVLDENTPRFDLGLFAGYGKSYVESSQKPYGAGTFCVAGTCAGLHCIVIASDPSLNAGAWLPDATEKILRAQKSAYMLGLPIIWLIECAGLFLPTQDQTYAGATGAGGIFEQQVRHANAGLPQIAAVFGDCIAGGGYLPIFCDHVIMTEQASICIGGTALNAFAKAGTGRLGGPDMHVHGSGCADERVPDDVTACRRLRELIACLPGSANAYYRRAEAIAPTHAIEALYSLIPADPKKSFDATELVARLVDGSLAEPILEDFGREIYAVKALVNGLQAIFITNQTQNLGSILSRDSILKLTEIVQEARDRGIPIVWLVDVSGFDIGENAEREGLLRYGANLLRSLTQDSCETPHMTLLIRKAAGAGFYAMKGRPFEPALIFGTVLTQLEVMSPSVLANTMYNGKIARVQADSEEAQRLIALKNALLAHQTEASTPQAAAARGDIDGILPLHTLRAVIEFFVESAWQGLKKHWLR